MGYQGMGFKSTIPQCTVTKKVTMKRWNNNNNNVDDDDEEDDDEKCTNTQYYNKT